jgi:FMN phosphatase YigB (HAD superfamily)
MTAPHDIVFLFDCDNTLLDNDRSGLWDAVDGRMLIYVHKEQNAR